MKKFSCKNNTFYIEQETETAYFVNYVQGGFWKTIKIIAVADFDTMTIEVSAMLGIDRNDYQFLTDFDYPDEYFHSEPEDYIRG